MRELSTFTLYDLLRQRRRWLQGILLTVYSNAIPWKYKLFMFLYIHSWALLPISLLNYLLFPMHSFPEMFYVDCLNIFTRSIHLYAFVFGVLKSYPLEQMGMTQFLLWIFASVFYFPFFALFMGTVALYSALTKKHDFYVVQKDFLSFFKLKLT